MKQNAVRLSQERNRWALPLTLALVLAAAAVLYREFLTGNSLYLYTVSDGFSQYLPLYRELIRRVSSGELSTWTMSVGFGAPQAYTLLLYPLNLPPLLAGALWGDGAMSVGFAWMQVVKIVLAALFMWLFLRQLAFSPDICAVMSVAYAFSGIIILRGNWRFPADECFLAALLLWAAERYFRTGKWRPLPLCVALLAGFGVYWAYLYALLLFLYATARFFLTGGTARAYLRFILPCAGLCLLGILLCGVVLIGFNWTMFRTARFGGAAHYAAGRWLASPGVLGFGAMSALNVNLTGCFDMYTGPLNYLERPIFFCGVGSLFLIVQAFWLGEKKERRLLAIVWAMAAVYLLCPPVMDVFNAFIRNEELGQRSYRLSALWILIAMVSTAACGLRRVKERGASPAAAALTGAVLAAALGGFFRLAPRYEVLYEPATFRWTAAMVAAWTLLLCLWRPLARRRGGAVAAAVLTLALMAADMAYNADELIVRSAVAADAAYSEMRADDMGYESGVGEALDAIRRADGGLYRIACERPVNNATYCYPQYFGFFDSSYYTNIDAGTYAFLREAYPQAFVKEGLGTKYAVGVSGDPPLSALCGYRYLVRPAGSAAPLPAGYARWDTVGAHEVFVNETPLSVGLVFDSYMTRSEFARLEEAQRRLALLRCVVVEDGETAASGPFLTAEEAARLPDVTSLPVLIRERQESQMTVTDWREDRIAGTVTADGDGKTLLLTVPRVYGWHVRVDGQPVEPITGDIGFLAVGLTAGAHTVELIYRPAALWIGAAVSAAAAAVYVGLLIKKKGARGGGNGESI